MHMPSNPSTETLPESAYVYLIELFIFLTLAIGVFTSDGLPVLPTAVLVAFGVSLLSMIVALLGVRLGYINRGLTLGQHPPAVVLNLLQAALHHSFAALLNFAVVSALVFSYDGDFADHYFKVLFRSSVTQTELWYLSRAGIIFQIALVFVLAGLLLAAFSIIRRQIKLKRQMRAHFVGLVNAYIFMNIALMYLMQTSVNRLCEGLAQDCQLSQFVEQDSIDVIAHLPVVIVFGGVFVLDMLAEFGFSGLNMVGVGLLFYVLPRLAMTAAVVILYFLLPEGNVLDVFPFWFRLMHSAVYGLAVLWEFVSGVSDVAQARRLRRDYNESSTDEDYDPTRQGGYNSPDEIGWDNPADNYGMQNIPISGVTKSVAFSRMLKRQPNKRFVFRRMGAGEKAK